VCGLVGLVELSGNSVSAERLQKMTECITYRGPDDSGIWVSGAVGLGHRRLSILDVSSAGRQPMSDRNEECWLAYNGEIYNHASLRAELPAHPNYIGSSDTEVLLRLIQLHGIESIARLNGIFAFAFIDTRTEELYLARDHFGIKPLYFAIDSDRFYFASEVKSILAGGLSPALEQLSAIDFAFSGWTSDQRTMFRGVQRLPPGHYLRYCLRTGAWEVRQWYRVKPNWNIASRLGSDQQSWITATSQALETAVERQLLSDVPVGAFCSGGVDSSLISAIALRQKKEVVLFNVACPDAPEIDEGPWAEAMAAHLGAELHTFRLNKRAFLESLVSTVYVTEYPLSFLNTVPLYLVSMLAQQNGVKVLLSGEGADECFGGYISQFPKLAMQFVAASKGLLSRTAIELALSSLSKIAKRTGLIDPAPASLGLHRVLSGGLYTANHALEASDIYKEVPDSLDRQLATELLRQIQTYLPPILHRTDRASMAASIEARVPFLDIDLVELVLAMPARLKIGVKGLRPVGKAILKQIACSYLPKDLVYRPKLGFTVPSSYYLDPWPESWIREGFLREAFCLQPDDLRSWLKQEKGQSAGWLLTLEIWGQLFVRHRTVDEVNAEFI
jgi:asparagine synthase (glutamine-hydrolysing)